MTALKFIIQDARHSEIWVEITVQPKVIPKEDLEKYLHYWGKQGEDKILDYVTALRKILLSLAQTYKHPVIVEHQLKGVLEVPPIHGIKVTGMSFLPIAEEVTVEELT